MEEFQRSQDGERSERYRTASAPSVWTSLLVNPWTACHRDRDEKTSATLRHQERLRQGMLEHRREVEKAGGRSSTTHLKCLFRVIALEMYMK